MPQRCLVELTEIEPCLRAGAAPRDIHVDALHTRQINDDAVVTRGKSGEIVPPTADRDGQTGGPGEPYGACHVGGVGAVDDQRRMLVDCAIPDLARHIVVRIPALDELATQRLPERLEPWIAAVPGCLWPI